MNFNSIGQTIIDALYMLPVLLITLPLHECAHGYVALKLGDPTAKMSGRLTMNPMKHFEPLGFICMIFVHFGWARPVPVNTCNFKKPKRDMAIVAAAGPISNLLFGLIMTYVYVTVSKLTYLTLISSSGFVANIIEALLRLLLYFAVANIGLAIFNLIPIVPLDGSRILYFFLPNHVVARLIPYEKYFQVGLLLLLFVGFLSAPLSTVSNAVFNLFVNISDKLTQFI